MLVGPPEIGSNISRNTKDGMDRDIEEHLKVARENPGRHMVFWNDRESPQLQIDSAENQLDRVKYTQIERPTQNKEN